MQTISDLNKSDKSVRNKIEFLSAKLKKQPFFLLIKPSLDIYTNKLKIKLFEKELEKLIKKGLTNLEIPWSSNKNWVYFMTKINLKFPKLNFGSASLLNKNSVDESIKIGLDYSMMKFWDKDLFIYAKKQNHLLIPGIKDMKSLEEAILLNCKFIKIYPVKEKDELIKISKYKDINFIAAGDLSINDIKLYKSLGYKGIVIGDKALKNKKFDPKIFEWFKLKYNKNL